MLPSQKTQRRLVTGCKVKVRVGAVVLSGGKRPRRIRSYMEGIIIDGGTHDAHYVYFCGLEKLV